MFSVDLGAGVAVLPVLSLLCHSWESLSKASGMGGGLLPTFCSQDVSVAAGYVFLVVPPPALLLVGVLSLALQIEMWVNGPPQLPWCAKSVTDLSLHRATGRGPVNLCSSPIRQPTAPSESGHKQPSCGNGCSHAGMNLCRFSG